MPDPRPTPRIPRDRIEQIIKASSGVPVSWETKRRPNLVPVDNKEKAFILLSMQSPTGVGRDEKRTKLDEDTNNLDTVIGSHRNITIVCKAYSWDPRIEAYDLCERVRFGFYRDVIHEMLVPTIALINCDGTHVLNDEEVSGRVLLSAVMDIRMRVVLQTDPANAYGGDWIATVDGNDEIPGTLEP